jgi:hypothetical protein
MNCLDWGIPDEMQAEYTVLVPQAHSELKFAWKLFFKSNV